MDNAEQILANIQNKLADLEAKFDSYVGTQSQEMGIELPPPAEDIPASCGDNVACGGEVSITPVTVPAVNPTIDAGAVQGNPSGFGDTETIKDEDEMEPVDADAVPAEGSDQETAGTPPDIGNEMEEEGDEDEEAAMDISPDAASDATPEHEDAETPEQEKAEHKSGEEAPDEVDEEGDEDEKTEEEPAPEATEGGYDTMDSDEAAPAEEPAPEIAPEAAPEGEEAPEAEKSEDEGEEEKAEGEEGEEKEEEPKADDEVEEEDYTYESK
jgi:hypothetical protein